MYFYFAIVSVAEKQIYNIVQCVIIIYCILVHTTILKGSPKHAKFKEYFEFEASPQFFWTQSALYTWQHLAPSSPLIFCSPAAAAEASARETELLWQRGNLIHPL